VRATQPATYATAAGNQPARPLPQTPQPNQNPQADILRGLIANQVAEIARLTAAQGTASANLARLQAAQTARIRARDALQARQTALFRDAARAADQGFPLLAAALQADARAENEPIRLDNVAIQSAVAGINSATGAVRAAAAAVTQANITLTQLRADLAALPGNGQ